MMQVSTGTIPSGSNFSIRTASMSKKGFQKLECSNLLSRRTDDSVLAILREVGREENTVMVSEEMVRILETDAEKAKAAASYVLWDLSRYSPFLLSESGAIPVLVELFQNTDAREVSALELYKLESGSPKSNWQLISDIKRRTNTTGLGEEDMLCIMSGPNKDADGSSVIITTTGNIKDNKNDSVHLQLLVGGPGSISTVE
ncbi:hypothetical protein MUK42_07979, partial [Musa troglodytarum]